ncbi:MAG: winged helix-turn-helix domain-containing protein [Acholeplasmatales bacterium]|nr:MAG: winged helix-turn-helix domain-containing protein [Acholeplasmatales bacterium]
MNTVTLTREQARRFIVHYQGLSGPFKYQGRQGILDLVAAAGCLQYDPIDAVGRNIDIVLLSRVEGIVRTDLEDCLYRDRTLMDHWDKVMSVCLMKDWPALRRLRAVHGKRHLDLLSNDEAVARVKAHLEKHGPLTAADLPDMGTSMQTARSRQVNQAALDALLFSGAAMIARRVGIKRMFALAQAVVPEDLYQQADPFTDSDAFIRWRLKRRIGAVGLLWGRRSDAYLGIDDVTVSTLRTHLQHLHDTGDIVQVMVAGLDTPLYALREAEALLEAVRAGAQYAPRLALIAPLDHFLWDRKLIAALFDFEYVWEVYTPEAKRQYGYYVLPILYGDELVGRIDVRAVRKKQALSVAHLWLEQPVPDDFHTALETVLEQFRIYLGLERIVFT